MKAQSERRGGARATRWAVCWGLAGLAAPRGLGAQSFPAAFSWVRAEGAEGCASREEALGAITARLGHAIETPTAGLSVEVVLRRAERWPGDVFLRDARGQTVGARRLEAEGPTCATLDASVALAVALALDPEGRFDTPATPRAPHDAPASEASAASPLAPSACPVCVAPRATSARRGARVEGGLRVGVIAASLPGAAPGVGLALQGYHPRWRGWEAVGWVFPEVSQPLVTGRVRLGLTGAAVAWCGLERERPRWSVRACAGTFLGALRVEGEGFGRPSVAVAPWWSLTLGMRARWRVTPRVWAEASLDANLAVTRQTFAVEGLGGVFTPALVGLVGALGGGVQF